LEQFKFRNQFAENVFRYKYAQGPSDTWTKLCERLVDDVCGTGAGKLQPLMSDSDRKQLLQFMIEMKFLPGGRYLYYAGRPLHAWNNCYLLRAEEDTREEWSNVTWRAMSCLMTGGGIGIDYSRLRPAGKALSRTGGTASGPLPLMYAINEIGRNVMQGGSRRSAIYASLNWQHEDIPAFLGAKNWSPEVKAAKEKDFNAWAPLDMTNISVNYDDAALTYGQTNPDNLHNSLTDNPVFLQNVRQAMETGEPGFSFNFGDKQNETLRNACTEVTSEDDSDVCNLGSINMGNITSLEEFQSVVGLASKFLVCGTLRADLPYEKVYKVRERNRRLGLGLMGIHEWLLQRHYKYEVVPELHEWLKVYESESTKAANDHCDRFYISRPVAYRAIAPTGSIGILAGTTTGIEPLFAVAYKRRFLTEGTKWKYQYVVDGTAKALIDRYGVDPDSIESALDLSTDYERRIKFQADIQDYVDMSISSTINLPAWGSKGNSEPDVGHFSAVLAKYAPRLRGFTCYPDGSRGGQPLTAVPYAEALKHKDNVYEETHDICEITNHGGSCFRSPSDISTEVLPFREPHTSSTRRSASLDQVSAGPCAYLKRKMFSPNWFLNSDFSNDYLWLMCPC